MTTNAEITKEVENEDVVTTPEEEAPIIDDDPMIAEMKEAEAEISAAEGKKEEDGEDKPESENEQKEPVQAKDGEEKEPITIPKPRFDQVLSDLNVLKEQLARQQGIIETQQAMLQNAGQKNPEQKQEEQGKGDSKVSAYDSIIEEANQKVIDASEKYEEGEISFKELKIIESESNNVVRKAMDDRYTAMVQAAQEEARNQTNQTVSQNTIKNRVEQEAIALAKDNPYIDAIETLPKAIADGIWAQINQEAMSNLAQKGVNVKDGTLQTQLALVHERARLTNVYGPQYTKVTNQQSGQPGKEEGKPSETAQNRAAKLELSESQPPLISSKGAADGPRDLTEADLENLSEDEMADLIASAPKIVQKAAGLKNL